MSHPERLGNLVRTTRLCLPGATTYIPFDSSDGSAATVFVRNNAAAHAVSVELTCSDAGAESPLRVPFAIGEAGSVAAGSTAAAPVPSPMRGVLVTVPAGASAGADVVILEAA